MTLTYTRLEHLSTIDRSHLCVMSQVSTLEIRWGILSQIRQTIALPTLGDIHEALQLIQAELQKKVILAPTHTLNPDERDIKEQFFGVKKAIALIERIDGHYGAVGRRDRANRSKCPRTIRKAS